MLNVASAPEILQVLSIQLATFMALLLSATALHRLAGQSRATAAIREFAGVPRCFARCAVVTISAAELMAAAWLCMPAWRAVGAGLAALIWGGYLFFILRAIANGRREIDCGCSFGAAHGPLGSFQVLRNSVLVGLAAAVALISANSGTAPLLVSQTLAGFALLALYGALDQVMALRPPRPGELL